MPSKAGTAAQNCTSPFRPPSGRVLTCTPTALDLFERKCIHNYMALVSGRKLQPVILELAPCTHPST
eukprot:627482-Pelagomonas_calceolata.AAC.5